MGKMSYVPRPGAGSQHVVTVRTDSVSDYVYAATVYAVMCTQQVIPGDGIGPELIDATERVVEALQAPITWERYAGPLAKCLAASHITTAQV